jgi:hydroxyacylglutathione hydrolase
VFGPREESIAGVTDAVSGGQCISVPGIDLALQVIDVPGHTRGHIAYVGKIDGASVVFCGDTLFAGGCGRLFEGTPEQMFSSLHQLAVLPPDTYVYCAHEYTQNNLRFALAVEPDNLDLRARVECVARQRLAGEATVPSSIGIELATNPFLRCDQASVMASAESFASGASTNALATFTALRAWKDQF